MLKAGTVVTNARRLARNMLSMIDPFQAWETGTGKSNSGIGDDGVRHRVISLMQVNARSALAGCFD
jgi:hypothetical protein